MNTVNVNILKVLSKLYEIFKDFFYIFKCVFIFVIPLFFIFLPLFFFLIILSECKLELYMFSSQKNVFVLVHRACLENRNNWYIFFSTITKFPNIQHLFYIEFSKFWLFFGELPSLHFTAIRLIFTYGFRFARSLPPYCATLQEDFSLEPC